MNFKLKMGKATPNKKKDDMMSGGQTEAFLVASKSALAARKSMELRDKMATKKEAGKPPRKKIFKLDLVAALSDQRAHILDSFSKIQIVALHKYIQEIAQTANTALETSMQAMMT